MSHLSKKNQIWSRIEKRLPQRGLSEYEELLTVLRQASREVEVSAIKRAQILERLMETLPNRRRVPFWEQTFQRFMAAGTLLSMTLLALLPVLPMPTTRALVAYSELSTIQGLTFLNGQPIEGTASLKVGDEIRTDSDAAAELRLFDDSLLVLAPGTELTIWALSDGSSLKGDTRVHVRLDEGELAAYAFNLAPEASFVVESHENFYELKQRGSYYLKLQDSGQDELVVTRNRVYVGEGLDREIVRPSELAFHEDFWDFSEQRREEHLSFVAAKYDNEPAILPGTPLYTLQQIQFGILSAISVPGIRENHLIAQAGNQLNGAKHFLRTGELDKAQKAMEDYKSTALALEDSGQPELLQQANVTQKEMLADSMLTEDESSLLTVLTEASLIVAPEPQEGEVLLNAASQQLAKILALVEAGETDALDVEMETYKDTVDSFIEQLDAMPMEDRQSLLAEVLEGHQADFDQLIELKADEEVYRQLGMILLSTQEGEVEHLPELFEDKDPQEQQEIYESVKDVVDLSSEIQDQLEVVEGSLDEGANLEGGIAHSEDAEEKPQAGE